MIFQNKKFKKNYAKKNPQTYKKNYKTDHKNLKNLLILIIQTSPFFNSFSHVTFISPTGKNPNAKQSGHRILADVDSLAVFESSSLLMPNIWGSIVRNNPAITKQVHSVRTTLIPVKRY